MESTNKFNWALTETVDLIPLSEMMVMVKRTQPDNGDFVVVDYAGAADGEGPWFNGVRQAMTDDEQIAWCDLVDNVLVGYTDAMRGRTYQHFSAADKAKADKAALNRGLVSDLLTVANALRAKGDLTQDGHFEAAGRLAGWFSEFLSEAGDVLQPETPGTPYEEHPLNLDALDVAQNLVDHDMFNDMEASQVTGSPVSATFAVDNSRYEFTVKVTRRVSDHNQG